MNLPGEKDISDMFAEIVSKVKELAPMIGDNQEAVKLLSKIQVTANLGKAVMLYKSSTEE